MVKAVMLHVAHATLAFARNTVIWDPHIPSSINHKAEWEEFTFCLLQPFCNFGDYLEYDKAFRFCLWNAVWRVLLSAMFVYLRIDLAELSDLDSFPNPPRALICGRRNVLASLHTLRHVVSPAQTRFIQFCWSWVAEAWPIVVRTHREFRFMNVGERSMLLVTSESGRVSIRDNTDQLVI